MTEVVPNPVELLLNSRKERTLEFSEVQKKLTQLPELTCALIAARCARRIQECFSRSWPEAPPKIKRTVERAISFAEVAPDQQATVIIDAMKAADAAAEANKEAAYHAACCAAHASRARSASATGQRSRCGTDAQRSAEAGVRATSLESDSHSQRIRFIRALDNDITRWQEAVDLGEINVDAQLSLDFFGPLWSDEAHLENA